MARAITAAEPAIRDSHWVGGYHRNVLPWTSLAKRRRSRMASRPVEEQLRRQAIAIVMGAIIGLAAVAVGVAEFIANIDARSPFIRFVSASIVVVFGAYMLWGSLHGLTIRRQLLREQTAGTSTDSPDNEELLAEIREGGQPLGEDPQSR
jgi:hypothetical protein